MTREQAIQAAETYGNQNGQSIMVYTYQGHCHLAHTLPMHGKRIGRYYPANYTTAGWVFADAKGDWPC